MCLFEGLNLGIAVPEFAVNFVAADVEIRVGKKLRHFLDELFQELVCLFAGWIGNRLRTVFIFDGKRSRIAR